MSDTIQEKIDSVANSMDADVLIYLGDIQRGFDDQIIDDCHKRAKLKRKNVLLMMFTRGGDPDAAYRIARCLQNTYRTLDVVDSLGGTKTERGGNFIVFIHGLCKSAGTLICLGANKIIMSASGELGPIDTQLPTENEVRGLTSGLTPIHAMNFLDRQTSISFKNFFVTLLTFHSRISTKMGSDVALQLAIGVMAPLYAQIDPLKLAEVDRSLTMATEYGKRLQSDNLKDGALERLLAAYPAHGFVIDSKEAGDIFKNLEEPSAELRELGDICRGFYSSIEDSKPLVWFASSPVESVEKMVERVQEATLARKVK